MVEERPENSYENPNDFYTLEETRRYETNSGMKKTQTELTNIILNLFFEGVNNQSKDISILDIGCGTGFSLEFLKNLGYNDLVGIDPAKEMLNICKKKGFVSYLGGFEDLPKDIKTKKFDLIISVSALQWILTNKQEMEIKNNIKALGKNLKNLLKENGRIIIQYYPPNKSSSEIIASSFERIGLNVKEYLYNEGNPKKQKHFLILKHK
jgi:SAM-dependent methyltransferase